MKKTLEQLNHGDLTLSRVRHYSQLAHRLKSQAFRHIFKGIVSSLFAGIQRYRVQKQMLKELDALDEHIMQDIGLSKNDIERLRTGHVNADELNQRRLHKKRLHKPTPARVSDFTLVREKRQAVNNSRVCEQSVASCA